MLSPAASSRTQDLAKISRSLVTGQVIQLQILRSCSLEIRGAEKLNPSESFKIAVC